MARFGSLRGIRRSFSCWLYF